MFARPIVGIFTNDPQVAAFGIECLQIVSLGYPFYAWGMVMEQAFNGAGDSATPTWINLFCYWIFQIPLAWTLAVRSALNPGVCIWRSASPNRYLPSSPSCFSAGKWKQVQV